ncbi:MAG: SpoIVB peptidase, partial [Clostridia bacterium]|nr:SpoIVB peptidase [Clostridia bacterium]
DITIYSDLIKLKIALDNGEVKEYTVEIQKIYLNNNSNNKSMLLKVTDKELLEKTGGIIQGMSGSPILQDGKLIGALTHVLVQNPTQGYAVFSDIMVKQMNDIK